MGEQSLTPNHNDNLPEKMDSTENVNESEQYDNEDISPEGNKQYSSHVNYNFNITLQNSL